MVNKHKQNTAQINEQSFQLKKQQQSTAQRFYQQLNMHYPKPYYHYLLLDTSRDDDIYPQIIKSKHQHMSLFKGKLPEYFRATTPYLLQIDKLDAAAGHWLERIMQSRCGLVFTSMSKFSVVYQHLRKLIRVKKYDGQYLHFRYHDAFHLYTWLHHAESQQQQQFFGPIAVLFGYYDHGQYYQAYLNKSAMLCSQVMSLNEKSLDEKFSLINDLLATHSKYRQSPKQTLLLEKKQLDALENNIEKKLLNDIHQYLLAQVNTAAIIKNLTKRAVILQIYQVMQRGRVCYSMFDRSNLYWLVANSFLVAAHFDSQPTIHAALCQQDISPSERINWINQNTSAADWQQAAKLNQPSNTSNCT